MSAILPLELIYDIIDELVIYPTADAFAYEEGVSQTLAALCRVSRAVRARAIFHLYSCIFIRSGDPKSPLARLLLTNLPHRSLTHTVAIQLDTSIPGAVLRVTNFVIELAPFLKRVLFLADNSLTFVVPESLIQALHDLPEVEDLAIMKSMRIRLYIAPTDMGQFNQFTSLRRLLLDSVQLGLDFMPLLLFLRRCPNLEILGISWIFAPWLDDSQTGEILLQSMTLTFELVSSLKEFVTFYSREYAGVVNYAATRYDGQVTVTDVGVSVKGAKLASWVADSVRSGTLWTVARRKWPLGQNESA